MPNANPIYDPGQSITGRATGAAVVGCRIVKVAAAKADGGNVPIAHCGAADEPLGVSGSNATQDDITQVYGDGFVLLVEVGGTGATAGSAAEVMATGVVQNFSAGRKVGIFLTTAAAAGFALVRVRF